MNSLRPGRARRAVTPLPPIDEEDQPPDQYTYPLDPSVPAYRNHLHRPPHRATDDYGHNDNDNDEARESSPELLVLIPVHKQRRGPTPENQPPPGPATPRHPGIAADNLNHKHPQYPTRLDREMKQRYIEIPTSTFEEKLLPGKNLTPRQFKTIGMLEDYDVAGPENDMYPALVSCCIDSLLLPDILNYHTVRVVQCCCGRHSRTHGLQGRRTLDGEWEHRPST